MFLSLDYWILAVILFVAWVMQILLSITPKSLFDFEWEERKKTFVNQANRLVYLFFSLPVAWIGNNYSLFGYKLTFLVWGVRIHAAFILITEILIFFIAIFSAIKKEIGAGRIALASLAMIAASALVALSV